MREGWIRILLVQSGSKGFIPPPGCEQVVVYYCYQLLISFICFSVNGEFCARQDLTDVKKIKIVIIVSCV